MASCDFNSKTRLARVFFRYEGRQCNRTIPAETRRDGERACALIERTILDLKRDRLALPEGADPIAFIVSGGRTIEKHVEERPATPAPVAECSATKETPTIARVFDIYATTLTAGTKDASSLATEAIHRRHVCRVLGPELPFDALDVAKLQEYVDHRAGEVGRETIRKELATLKYIWTWAHKRKHVAHAPTWKPADLTLPKGDEKPPFQTWAQITRRVERGGLSTAEQHELWECLWLDQVQTLEILAFARKHARQPVVPLMVAFAAYTGARRSEMIRSERDDWDFAAGTVAIREKKADKSRHFTRRTVPIHPTLADAMRGWFKAHPGGPWTLSTSDGEPLSPLTASRYFRALVKGSKWAVVNGWHVFRHSLASNMASDGHDQRIINEILGHHTEAMERRYRHLLPYRTAHALGSLFRAG
jgi:integrase